MRWGKGLNCVLLNQACPSQAMFLYFSYVLYVCRTCCTEDEEPFPQCLHHSTNHGGRTREDRSSGSTHLSFV